MKLQLGAVVGPDVRRRAGVERPRRHRVDGVRRPDHLRTRPVGVVARHPRLGHVERLVRVELVDEQEEAVRRRRLRGRATRPPRTSCGRRGSRARRGTTSASCRSGGRSNPRGPARPGRRSTTGRAPCATDRPRGRARTPSRRSRCGSSRRPSRTGAGGRTRASSSRRRARRWWVIGASHTSIEPHGRHRKSSAPHSTSWRAGMQGSEPVWWRSKRSDRAATRSRFGVSNSGRSVGAQQVPVEAVQQDDDRRCAASRSRRPSSHRAPSAPMAAIGDPRDFDTMFRNDVSKRAMMAGWDDPSCAPPTCATTRCAAPWTSSSGRVRRPSAPAASPPRRARRRRRCTSSSATRPASSAPPTARGSPRCVTALDAVEVDDDPRRSLVRLLDARAPLRAERPMLFELMYSRPFAEFSPGPADREAAVGVYRTIVAAVRRWLRAAGDPGRPPRRPTCSSPPTAAS